VRLLTSDGGILDPDDNVCDVVDDREQVSTALSTEVVSLVCATWYLLISKIFTSWCSRTKEYW